MLENFGIKDIIDIFLVAIFMYQAYRMMKRSGTSTIFNGVLAFVWLWILVSRIFQMRLLGSILDAMMNIGLFVIIILFQDDIRRFLTSIGSYRMKHFFSKVFQFSSTKPHMDVYTPIILACMNMAKTKTGAIIVIEENVPLDIFSQTGECIDAEISTRLIENIFFKNSPLHDGAMIVSKGKLHAAGCILPVSQLQNLPKELGLRHRAALGIAQETDAKVIIVSEERGKISYAHEGVIYPNVSAEELRTYLVGNKQTEVKAPIL